MVEESLISDDFPVDLLPLLTWPKFSYGKQDLGFMSESWQTFMIAANGTGKTLWLYESIMLFLLGIHMRQFAVPPLKCRVLVPSFDNVEDVALEKLMQDQTIVFKPPLSDPQRRWVDFLRENGQLKGFNKKGYLEIGPILPERIIKAKKGYKKEHKGIELIDSLGGSSIWWATGEQGWQSQRGGEHDILCMDEEGPKRVWDEQVRGLRNAKNGGKVLGSFTPPIEEGQGPTWTKEHILDASFEDPDITVINACMADNPAITDTFIERFKKGKTLSEVRTQVYGDYPTWGDLVHPDFEDRLWDEGKMEGHLLPNDHPMPRPHDVDWVMAFDWHPSKETAAVFGWIGRDGNPVFFDELDKKVAHHKEVGELAEIFRAIEGHPWQPRKFRRWQDPSAKHKHNLIDAWSLFRREGIITNSGENRDPNIGIDIVNQYFRGNGKDAPRIFIYERCKYTRKFLKNHYWKRGEDGVGKPDPKWSDYPICIRYIIQDVGWKHQAKHRRKKWPLVSYA